MILAVCSLSVHQLSSSDDDGGDEGGEAQLLAAVLSGLQLGASSEEVSSRGIQAVGDTIISDGGGGGCGCGDDGIMTKGGAGLMKPATVNSSGGLRCEVWLTAPCLIPLVARSLESLTFTRESVDIGA